MPLSQASLPMHTSLMHPSDNNVQALTCGPECVEVTLAEQEIDIIYFRLSQHKELLGRTTLEVLLGDSLQMAPIPLLPKYNMRGGEKG